MCDIATRRLTSLRHPSVRTLGIVTVPAAALLLLHWFNSTGASVPAPLIGMQVYAPYAALLLAGFIGVWFNRGRALLGLICLGIAQVVYAGLQSGEVDADLVAPIYALLCAFVPINLAALAL